MSTVAPRNSPTCIEFQETLDSVDRNSHSIGIASQLEVITILSWLAAVLTSLSQLRATSASPVVSWRHDPPKDVPVVPLVIVPSSYSVP